MESDQEQEKSDQLIAYYKRYVGWFVTVIKKDTSKRCGILKDILPSNQLYIVGTHGESFVHISNIQEFTARPDKMQNGQAGSSEGET